MNDGFLASVHNMVDRAFGAMDLPPGLADQIKQTNSLYRGKIPVQMRGEVQVFTGWRAVHSEHRLPTKGGIRYSELVKQDEIEALAALMGYTGATVEVPCRGSNCGLETDAAQYLDAQ